MNRGIPGIPLSASHKKQHLGLLTGASFVVYENI
jgi:hypothetical protein